MQSLTSANAALADTAHKIMYNAFLHPVEQAIGDLISKIQDSLLVWDIASSITTSRIAVLPLYGGAGMRTTFWITKSSIMLAARSVRGTYSCVLLIAAVCGAAVCGTHVNWKIRKAGGRVAVAWSTSMHCHLPLTWQCWSCELNWSASLESIAAIVEISDQARAQCSEVWT